MQDKIETLNRKIDEMQERATQNAAIIDAKREAKREQIEEEIEYARSNVEATKQRVEDSVENVRTVAASEVSKLRAGIDKAKQKIADKKEAHDRKHFEAYINDLLDYADSCAEVAILAMEEAKLATLEAFVAQMEFCEKYGEQLS